MNSKNLKIRSISILISGIIGIFQLPACGDIQGSSDDTVASATPSPSPTTPIVTYALGQSSLTTKTIGVTAATMNTPYGVHFDGTRLFVADNSNNRVLIWNSKPSATGTSADLVLGQASMTTNTTGTTATTMSGPVSVFSTGSRLFVVDGGNHRVLVWNSIPTSNGQAADLVLGQASMTTAAQATTATGMKNPIGLIIVGTKLLVSDTGNHRVLIWNTLPTASTTAADVAIGQANLTTGTSGTTATTFWSPEGLYSDGTKLFVTDFLNCRALIYNTIPTTNGAAANTVLGQTTMTASSCTTTATSLNLPQGISGYGTKLFIADTTNHRILVWNTIPTSNGQTATSVFGQASFTVKVAGVSETGINLPFGLSTDGTHLFIADQGNNRILALTPLP